jgi:orotate phosphoribosyltransferase
MSQNTNIASEVAKMLLQAEAIKLSPSKPFKWSSGWNSPIYCDNRVTLSFPASRTFIKESLAAKIKAEFPNVEAIAGVATAGIPQGALVADLLNIPFIYVRPKAKEHGMGNQIEGKVTPGQKVVLIEDLISTGGSSLKAAEALIAQDITVLGMVAIFTYGFSVADDNFEAAGIKLHCLSNYEEMLKVAVSSNYIKESDIDSLAQWRENPSVWGV